MANWKEEVKFDLSKGREFLSSCNLCSNETKHKILTSVLIDQQDVDYHYEDGQEIEYAKVCTTDKYQIIRCLGCESVSFLHSNMVIEPGNTNPNTGLLDLITEEERYPKFVLGNKFVRDLLHLPGLVSDIYQETRSALANGLGILAGMGLRALIEAVCKEKTVKGRNLEEKIENMFTAGLISRSDTDFLHGLRILGNEAAHEGKRYSNEDLLSALEIVEHLLNSVYLIPLRAKNLPKRHA